MQNAKLTIKSTIAVAAFLLMPIYAHAAVYIVGPEQKTAQIREEVEIRIGVDTESERLNLFNVQVQLPKGFDFVSFDKESSVVDIWVKEPVFDAETRKVSFIGGVPGGFVGRAVLVNALVKPLKSGDYSLVVESSSEAYLNDGLGTQATMRFNEMNLKIEGAALVLPIWAWALIIIIALGVIIWIVRRKYDK